RPRHDDPGNVDSGHIALQGLRIALRAIVFLVQAYAHAAQEVIVGVVAGKGKYKIILDPDLARKSAQQHAILPDLAYARLEVSLDFPILYTIFDVRFNPILYVWVHAAAAMHQCHPSPAPPQFQGCDSG